MSGVKTLRRVQLGQEVTPGTAVAATAVWRGMGVLADNREVVEVEEDIGYLGGVDRTYIPKTEGAIDLVDTPATFEQVGYPLSAGIKNVVTGTADTGGSGKIYDYTFGNTSQNTVKTYLIEGGDNQQEEEMAYAFCQSISFSGVGGEALMVSSQWVGRAVADGTFTTQPAIPTVEEILFGKGKLYIDAIGGTIGSTQVSNTLLEADISIDTGVIPKYTADGSLDFSHLQYVDWEVSGSLTFEHNATAVTEKGNWRTETARLIRLDLEGSTLNTAGSSHSVKLLRFDLPVKYSTVDPLGDQDGNATMVLNFRSRYNPTAALGPSIKLVNELATLT